MWHVVHCSSRRLLKVAVAVGGTAALAFDAGCAFSADRAKSSATNAPTSPGPAQSPAVGAAASKLRHLDISNAPWKGDFDQMLERREIRALVPISRTLYYSDKGRERGITAELLLHWERTLNNKYAKQLGKRPVTLLIIPTTRDKLISGLVEGLGDVAAGNITVTEQGLSLVDFVSPADLPPVNEIVVTGPKAPTIKSVEDLSGKVIHVRKATAYYESLVALNMRFAREGKPSATLVHLLDALEDEDKLEMVNAGLLDIVIVDDWLADIWSQILPNIKVVREAPVRIQGHIGWAHRENSPKLHAALTNFYTAAVENMGLVTYLKTQQQRHVKQLTNNTADQHFKRFQEIVALFDKYGAQYNFDPLMLAALGYQESTLNQQARSAKGAIGVMQVMPATGAQLKVGDIRMTESNIHAGAKHLDQLMAYHFSDAKFSERNRALFAFASYNAGPEKIARMRTLAVQRGLDPDEWFNNVEIVASEKIGIETTTYVRNIYKYYVAYKLAIEQRELRTKLKEQFKTGH